MNTPSTTNRKVETLKSITRSLFCNTSSKRDSPLKNGPSQSSPASVITKTLVADIDVYYEALAPDSLFKLLQDFKWKMAVSHIAQFQDESFRWWIVDHDDKNKKILYRRLPIHEACIRNPTIEVIDALLRSYPEGASARDDRGRTPLHCAVIHGAHIDVVYLLLHASYDVIQGRDFFHKIPKEYACTTVFAHKDAVIAALTEMSKEDIAAAAAGVRAAIQASTPICGKPLLNETTKQERSTSDEAAEQLSQALVDSDAANTICSIAVANERASRVQVANLQAQVIVIKKKLEKERENQENSQQNCIFLLEKKQETFINSLTEKDEEIKRLKEKAQRGKQQRHADAVIRQKLQKTVSTLTQRLAGNEEESEEKELEVVHSETAVKSTAIKELLDNTLEASGQKVIALEEDINKVHDENDALKAIVENYHRKLSHLEASFYDLSGHLVERSEQLSTANSDLKHLDEERMRLAREGQNADTRIESLEALIGEYDTDLQDSGELSKIVNTKIRELEDIIMEYDQENQSLDEKCSAYEDNLDGVKKIRGMASKKIESLENALDSIDSDMALKNDELEQLVVQYSKENTFLVEKYNACHEELESCKTESRKKMSSLEDLVRMYRQKSEKMEEYRAKAKEATSTMERLEKDDSRIRMDRSVSKWDLVLAKACQKNMHLSSSKYKEGDLNRKTKKLELRHTRATEQLVDRIGRSSFLPLTSRNIRPPLASRTRRAADNRDCMSVCSVSNSVVSCNSVTSTQSAWVASSSSSRRSTLLALRTKRPLKDCISTRDNEMMSSSFI